MISQHEQLSDLQHNPLLRADVLVEMTKLGIRPVFPTIRQGFELLGDNEQMGYSVGIDLEPIPRWESSLVPQQGILDFTRYLGIDQQDLLTIYPFGHTNNVIEIEDKDSIHFIAPHGRSVPTDRGGPTEESWSYDGLIVKETPDTKGMVLSLTGGDCTPIVMLGEYSDGTRMMVGIHAGRKGALSGVIENTVDRMVEAGAKPRSFQALIGAGAQAMEVPAMTIGKESALNVEHMAIKEVIGDEWVSMLGKSVLLAYGDVDSKEDKVLYSNQLDAAYRLALTMAKYDLLSRPIEVVMADTMMDDRFMSHREMTAANKAGLTDYASTKKGRNMTFVRFN